MQQAVSDTKFQTSAEARRSEMQRDPEGFIERLRRWQEARRAAEEAGTLHESEAERMGSKLTWLETLLANPVDVDLDPERDRGSGRGTPLDLFE